MSGGLSNGRSHTLSADCHADGPVDGHADCPVDGHADNPADKQHRKG